MAWNQRLVTASYHAHCTQADARPSVLVACHYSITTTFVEIYEDT